MLDYMNDFESAKASRAGRKRLLVTVVSSLVLDENAIRQIGYERPHSTSVMLSGGWIHKS
jgi:hypothetical protein